jgi:mediator of replication checkpoint protein 1
METPDTYIRRAPRTYGRRKAPDASDIDAALAAESSASSNYNSPTYSESGHDVPPSSDFETSFNQADDGDVGDAPDDERVPQPQFGFDWKRKMQDIDKQYDCDDDMDDAPPQPVLATGSAEWSRDDRSRATHGISADEDGSADDEEIPALQTYRPRSVKDDLARIELEFDESEVTGSHKGRIHPLSAEDPDDPFGHPLPILTTSSQPTQTKDSSLASSRSPSPQIRRLAKRRAVHVLDSEADGEIAPHSPQTSPSALHPINTPKTTSSPTPPTTDEMNKGGGKGKARNETTAQEESDELPKVDSTKAHSRSKGKTKEKSKRVKVHIHTVIMKEADIACMQAPTRKEVLETQKSMARIKAEQSVALPRKETRIPVMALWEKLM